MSATVSPPATGPESAVVLPLHPTQTPTNVRKNVPRNSATRRFPIFSITVNLGRVIILDTPLSRKVY